MGLPAAPAPGSGKDKPLKLLYDILIFFLSKIIAVLKAAGTEINVGMKIGETPLALAIQKKRYAAAQLLKIHGGIV